MKFEKGKSGNKNGRPKGRGNFITMDMRSWIKKLLEDNQQQFEADMKKLEAHQRVVMFEKLLSYVVPKCQAIEIDTGAKKFQEEVDELMNSLKKENHEEY